MNKSIIIPTISFLTMSLFCHARASYDYENKITVEPSGLSYERLKKDDIYVSAGINVAPFLDFYAISGRAGYNFKAGEQGTFTPYFSAMFIQGRHQGSGWMGTGVKYDHRITDYISTGLSVEAAIRLHKNAQVVGALEVPVTFHMGKEKKYEIETRPYIGIVDFNKKSTHHSGLLVGFGYRF